MTPGAAADETVGARAPRSPPWSADESFVPISFGAIFNRIQYAPCPDYSAGCAKIALASRARRSRDFRAAGSQ
jgi:hypothetical protein